MEAEVGAGDLNRLSMGRPAGWNSEPPGRPFKLLPRDLPDDEALDSPRIGAHVPDAAVEPGVHGEVAARLHQRELARSGMRAVFVK